MKTETHPLESQAVGERRLGVEAGEGAGSLTLARKILLWAGSIGPLGHAPASGMVTVALIGVPLFWVMASWPVWVYVACWSVFTLASVWIHEVGDRLLQEKDSRRLVWDELVGYGIAVACLPFTWRIAAAAFFLERAIDILKVPPARWIERRWPGGWGVVGDDVVAGLYTLGLMRLLCGWRPEWMGL